MKKYYNGDRYIKMQKSHIKECGLDFNSSELELNNSNKMFTDSKEGCVNIESLMKKR